MALSTRGRGAHSAPVRRHHQLPPAALPERQRDVDGDRLAVRRDRRPRHAAALLLPATSRTSPASPFGRSRTSTPSHPHVDPLDQQLHDPRLLGREQLVPQRVELQQRLPHLVLGDVVLLGPRRAPRADDDLRLPEDAAQLVDDRRLDLRRRHPPDRAGIRPALQHVLADVVAVEPVALAGVRRRHRRAGRPEDQPLQQRRRLRPGVAPSGCGCSRRGSRAPCPRASWSMIAACSPG